MTNACAAIGSVNKCLVNSACVVRWIGMAQRWPYVKHLVNHENRKKSCKKKFRSYPIDFSCHDTFHDIFVEIKV